MDASLKESATPEEQKLRKIFLLNFALKTVNAQNLNTIQNPNILLCGIEMVPFSNGPFKYIDNVNVCYPFDL